MENILYTVDNPYLVKCKPRCARLFEGSWQHGSSHPRFWAKYKRHQPINIIIITADSILYETNWVRWSMMIIFQKSMST